VRALAWVAGAWAALAPITLAALVLASHRMGDAFDVEVDVEDDVYGPVFAAAYVGVAR
jgi:hypothetical protein